MGFNSGFKGLKIILTFYDYSALVSIDNLANRNWNVKLAEESGHSIIWGWFTLLPCEEGLRKITTSFSWYWEFRDRDWSPRTPERETWIWSYIVWHLELHCLTFGATLSDIWSYIVWHLELHFLTFGATLSDVWSYNVWHLELHCLTFGATLSDIWSYNVWHLELHCLTFGATLSDIWSYIVWHLTNCPLRTAANCQTVRDCCKFRQKSSSHLWEE